CFPPTLGHAGSRAASTAQPAGQVLPPASLPPPSVNSAAARPDPPGPALDPGQRHRPSLFPDGVGPGGPTAGLNPHFAAMAEADMRAVCLACRISIRWHFRYGRT